MPAEYIETSSYERDGIMYNITIMHSEGGYWARCYCTECGESDAGSKNCDTPEEAKLFAENSAEVHHSVTLLPDKS